MLVKIDDIVLFHRAQACTYRTQRLPEENDVPMESWAS